VETAAVGIDKGAVGDFFLMISTAAWKSREQRRAFPQLPRFNGDQQSTGNRN
jgi:hypothetical protein